MRAKCKCLKFYKWLLTMWKHYEISLLTIICGTTLIYFTTPISLSLFPPTDHRYLSRIATNGTQWSWLLPSCHYLSFCTNTSFPRIHQLHHLQKRSLKTVFLISHSKNKTFILSRCIFWSCNSLKNHSQSSSNNIPPLYLTLLLLSLITLK